MYINSRLTDTVTETLPVTADEQPYAPSAQRLEYLCTSTYGNTSTITSTRTDTSFHTNDTSNIANMNKTTIENNTRPANTASSNRSQEIRHEPLREMNQEFNTITRKSSSRLITHHANQTDNHICFNPPAHHMNNLGEKPPPLFFFDRQIPRERKPILIVIIIGCKETQLRFSRERERERERPEEVKAAKAKKGKTNRREKRKLFSSLFLP